MPSSTRPRVLIADDHPGVLQSLQRMLAFDCDVVGTVGDSGALLESTARFQPDVVIVDLNMPTVSGLEACRQLSRLHPAVKVILMSGADDTDIAEHALASGAAAFFVKFTVAQEQLVGTIRR